VCGACKAHSACGHRGHSTPKPKLSSKMSTFGSWSTSQLARITLQHASFVQQVCPSPLAPAASTGDANEMLEPMSDTRRYRRVRSISSNSAITETRPISPASNYRLLIPLSVSYSAVINYGLVNQNNVLFRIFRGYYNRKRERRKILVVI